MLSRREHSERELTAKLAAKGYNATVVAPLITELKAQGLLSDSRFADALVHARMRRGYGPLRIIHELRDKGIDDALIDGMIDADDPCWTKAVAEIRQKKYGKNVPKDYKEWARQARFLQSRGFTTEQIRRATQADETD